MDKVHHQLYEALTWFTEAHKLLDLEWVKSVLTKLRGNEADVRAALLTITQALCVDTHTFQIVNTLNFILPELLGLLSNLQASDNLLHIKERCVFVTLANVAMYHPDGLPFCLKYFTEERVVDLTWKDDKYFEKTHNQLVSSGIWWLSPSPNERIIFACHVFLRLAPNQFVHLWNWADIFPQYLIDDSKYVRWLAAQCLAIVTNASSFHCSSYVSKFIPQREICDCEMLWDREWSTKKDRCYSEAKIISTPSYLNYVGKPSFFTHSVVVGGICLPVVRQRTQANYPPLVLLESTLSALRNMAVCVASGRAVCLTGPVGVGKTSLVEHLAQLTGRDSTMFSKVHLSEQTDGKLLIGTHCLDKMGEFVFIPGMLTKAIANGHWILLEDVDTAPSDVLAVIASILENKEVHVPGITSIKISPGFQLFITRRTSSNCMKHSVSMFNHCRDIKINRLDEDDLRKLVSQKYPRLESAVENIIKTFLIFAGQDKNGKEPFVDFLRSSSGRLISTRDLIKVCERSTEQYHLDPGPILLSMFDLWCAHISHKELRYTAATVAGNIFTKAVQYVINYFLERKPQLKIQENGKWIEVGNVRLLCKGDLAQIRSTTSLKFAWTQQAASLTERLANCVKYNEPVLLVGETGTGKTFAVQHLADKTGNKLIVINMSHHSDLSDLLGGYKPILNSEIKLILEEFKTLLTDFLPKHEIVVDWKSNLDLRNPLSALHSVIGYCRIALQLLQATSHEEHVANKVQPTVELWENLLSKAEYKHKLFSEKSMTSLQFVEGCLVVALKEGHWILLDEINLAPAETLESLSGLLENSSGSIHLLERGDPKPLIRHDNFRLFGCMNPATDVGKKNLTFSIRNRFTELYVDEIRDIAGLVLVIQSYYRVPAIAFEKIAQLYIKLCNMADKMLTDGNGHRPHYSLRTLVRTLKMANCNPCHSMKQSLYEAFCVGFLPQLDSSSYSIVKKHLYSVILASRDSGVSIKHDTREGFTLVEGYWIRNGALKIGETQKYVLTKTVKENLKNLARIVSFGNMPVLLEGPTSVGKTSLVMYLAARTGNSCVRINNHEHTDIQEYVGTYCSNENGHLIFSEGPLVTAMRQGFWLILDELNLATTDILEALNRLLDDNRELYIPETQETVKAHESFRVFATQNPVGMYGGRKKLSRAFRDRFLALHFDVIPSEELGTILHERCSVPPTTCNKMVSVLKKFYMLRRSSAAFAGREGFMTLRDLFRWGERYQVSSAALPPGRFYDWNKHMAEEGYLLLAAKVRKLEECTLVQSVIEQAFKTSLNLEQLFTLNKATSTVTKHLLEMFEEGTDAFQNFVFTKNMRVIGVMIGRALEMNEPVLLVGETGLGKTSLVQWWAQKHAKTLYTVNCHLNTDSSEFLGGLRPVRNRDQSNNKRLFEWVDGPLVTAMETGNYFLVDEISLADDSVLERLNPLLESERTILLSEKGNNSDDKSSLSISADENFKFFATMNPSGDYCKKELSPALRNRFTEIWCNPCKVRDDLIWIIKTNFLNFSQLSKLSDLFAPCMIDFVVWLGTTDFGKSCKFNFNVRDLLSWVQFINNLIDASDKKSHLAIHLKEAYVHGGMTIVAGLDVGNLYKCDNDVELQCLQFLCNQMSLDQLSTSSYVLNDQNFGIHPFYVEKGPNFHDNTVDSVAFNFKKMEEKLLPILRAMTLNKPILLEGKPGVGKTALVSALAKIGGHKLIRINLSSQTDICDLFGSDAPAEGGKAGEFVWRDGPLLLALKAGQWILLDELNLAPAAVLEGLNACLDHRQEIFVPELARTFSLKNDSTGDKKHVPRTRIFATQNSFRDGADRKALPKSFLNRFSKVYVKELSAQNYLDILSQQFPHLPQDFLVKMVGFHMDIVSMRLLSDELNVRDLIRWCQLLSEQYKLMNNMFYIQQDSLDPWEGANLLYLSRLSGNDLNKALVQYCSHFPDAGKTHACNFKISLNKIRFDNILVCQNTTQPNSPFPQLASPPCLKRGKYSEDELLVLQNDMHYLVYLMKCVSMGWHPLLVGPSGIGKTTLVKLLSRLVDIRLDTIFMDASMDTTEILGGFQQWDWELHIAEVADQVEALVMASFNSLLLGHQKPKTGFGQLDNFQPETWKPHAHNSTDHWNIWKMWFIYKSTCFHGMAEDHSTFKANILRQLALLEKIVSSLPQASFCDEELNKVMRNLDDLKQQVEINLNTSGKFEWVDSVLIKCLKEGTWLLVENVNLCPPAILDRLNGLLEQDGELSLTERGVDGNIQVISIKPHNNFRIFFTMDSMYGLSSKAMRNRCVEILVNHEHMNNFLQDIIEIPVHPRRPAALSLLQQSGIQDTDILLDLLDMYKIICQNADVLPSQSQLIQVVCQVGEYISRGLPIWNVTQDTSNFLHSSSGQTFVEIWATVWHHFQNNPKQHIFKDEKHLVKSYCLSTQKLRVMPSLALSEQELVLMWYTRIFKMSIIWDVLLTLVVILIENSSNYDELLIKAKVLDNMLTQFWPTTVQKDIVIHGHTFVHMLKNWVFYSNKDNSMMGEFYNLTLEESRMLRKSPCSVHDQIRASYLVEAKVIASLERYFFCIDMKRQWKSSTSLRNDLSLHEAVTIKVECERKNSSLFPRKLVETINNVEVVSSFIQPLLEAIDECLEQVLKSSETLFDDNALNQLHLIMVIRGLLFDLDSRKLIKFDKALNQWYVNDDLRLRIEECIWRISVLTTCLEKLPLSPHLESMISELKDLCQKWPDPLKERKLREVNHQLRKYFPLRLNILKNTHFKPHISVLEASNQANLWKKDIPMRAVLFMALPKSEELIECFLETAHTDKMIPYFLELLNNVINQKNPEDFNASKLASYVIPIRILQDYQTLLLCNAARALNFMNMNKNTSLSLQDERLVESAMQQLLSTASIPMKIKLEVISYSFSKRVLSRYLLQFCDSAISLNHGQVLSSWDLTRLNPERGIDDFLISSEKDQISMDSPVLSVLLNIATTSNRCHTPNLLEELDFDKKIKHLHHIAWTNMIFIGTNRTDYMTIERQSTIALVDNLAELLEENTSGLLTKLSECYTPEEWNMLQTMFDHLVKDAEFLRNGDNKDWFPIWIAIINIWLRSGSVQASIFSKIGLVPLEFRATFDVMLHDFEKHQLLARTKLRTMYDEVISGHNEFCHNKTPLLLKFWESRLDHLGKLKQRPVAPRPQHLMFREMAHACSHYANNVASARTINLLCDALVNLNGQLQTNAARDLCTKVDMWLNSNQRMLEELSSKYETLHYDYLEEVLLAGTQISHGLIIMKNTLLKYINSNAQLSSLVRDLFGFPSLQRQDKSITDVMDRYLSGGALELLKENIWGEEDIEQPEKIQLNIRSLQLAALKDMLNEVLVKEELDTNIWNKCNKLITEIVVELQNDSEKRVKDPKDYIYRTANYGVILTDEEQLERDFENWFPTFSEDEFIGKPSGNVSTGNLKKVQSFEEYTVEVSYYHSSIVRLFMKTTREASENLSQTQEIDWEDGCLQRYPAACDILEKHKHAMPASLDKLLSSSFTLMLSKLHHINNPRSQGDKLNDFYKDSNIEDVRRGAEVVQNLLKDVRNLLKQYPDNPILNEILVITGRIIHLPITSPLSCFKTGYHLLLTKIQDWEIRADQLRSLATHLAALNKVIYDWMILELSYWKDLLNISATRINNATIVHWWPLLFSLVSSTYNGEVESTTKLLEALDDFMTTSSLGEFRCRLSLLYTCYCHFSYPEKNPSRVDVALILLNVYKHHRMFLMKVEEKLNELTKPIERDLKNLVKTIRWNPRSFVSAKDSVRRTQKSALTLLRKFETVLKLPYKSLVMSKLPLLQPVKHWSVISENFKITSLYIADNIKASYHRIHEEKVLGQKECLDSFFNISDYLDDVISLNELQINKDETLAKQKSKAKNIKQQRMNFYSTLFKTLEDLNFSYRRGIVGFDENEYLFKVMHAPVVDVPLMLQQLCDRKEDQQLLEVFQESDEHFQSCVDKFSKLLEVIVSPSTDVGIQNLQKMKGFSCAGMMEVIKGKWDCSESVQLLGALRHLLEQVKSLAQVKEGEVLVIQDWFQHWKERLIATLVINLIHLKQVILVLKTKPTSDFVGSCTNINSALCEEIGLVYRHKQDSKSFDKIIDFFESVELKCKTLMKKVKSELPSQPNYTCLKGENLLVITSNHRQYLNDAFATIHDYGILIVDAVHKAFSPSNCILSNHLNVIADKFISVFNEFKTSESAYRIKWKKDNYIDQSKQTILITHLLDKTVEMIASSSKEVISSTDASLQIVQGNLKGTMSPIVSHLNILIESTTKLHHYNPDKARASCKSQYFNLLLNLEHYVSSCQFDVMLQIGYFKVLNRLMSVLLVIFIDFITKGFRIPPELADEEGKEGKATGGMGFGDGEGETDMSKDIVSQDQLEEALPNTDEPQEKEEKPCEEEEDGIDMSEDFGGLAQDTGGKGSNDEDSDEMPEDDEDVDKEMGPTSPDANELDKRVGSDSEEGEGEDGEDGAHKSGEKTSEPEMAGKSGKQPEEQQELNEESPTEKENIDEEIQGEDDQVDQTYGQAFPELEIEPLDLSDEMDLDGNDQQEENGAEENNFDIDKMKELEPEEGRPEEAKDIEPKTADESDAMSTSDIGEEKGKDAEMSHEEDDAPEMDSAPDEHQQDDQEDQLHTEETPVDHGVSKNPSEEKVEPMDVEEGSKDQVSEVVDKDTKSAGQDGSQDECQEGGENDHGVGQAPVKESEMGHHQEQSSWNQGGTHDKAQDYRNQSRRSPWHDKQDRALGDSSQPLPKRLKTVDISVKNTEDIDEEANQDDYDLYQHVKDTIKTSDNQTLDSATKEEIDKQLFNQEQTKEQDENMTLNLDAKDINEENEIAPPQPDDKVPSDGPAKKRPKASALKSGEDRLETKLNMQEEEGDIVPTLGVPRLQENVFVDNSANIDRLDPLEDFTPNQRTLEQIFAERKEAISNEEALSTWKTFLEKTLSQAQDLSEQLRIVLHPTQASGFKGDYRTGRRINMRKIIPYIASEFRKDKIWLRRTKLTKRDYQIILAVDDSLSMSDVQAKERTLEYLALVTQAFGLLEVGDVGVVCYGIDTKILHALGQPFTHQSGASLIQNLSFTQAKTNVSQMVDFVTSVFQSNTMKSSSSTKAQLLLIVSDGRNINSEGPGKLERALTRSHDANIFTLYIILDDQESSILDIERTTFENSAVPLRTKYMEKFPFRYYIILNDTSSLSTVMADALKQFLELMTQFDV